MADRPTLLLVEDDENVRRALTRALRAEGVEVHEVGTAGDALDLAQRDRYDAVVADYHLGGRNGASLLEELEQYQPRTMRVLITGDATVGVKALRQRGVFHLLLTKPFAVGALVDRLRLRVSKRHDTLRDLDTDD